MQPNQPYSTWGQQLEQPVSRTAPAKATGGVATAGQFGAGEAAIQQPAEVYSRTPAVGQQYSGLEGIQRQPTEEVLEGQYGVLKGQRGAQTFAQPALTSQQPVMTRARTLGQSVPVMQVPATGHENVAASPQRVTSQPTFGRQRQFGDTATRGQQLQFASPTQFGQQTAAAAEMTGGTATAGQMTREGEGEGRVEQQLAPAKPKPATSPYVDIFDNPDKILVVADLPGCGPEDIDLQVSNSSLRIIGERKSESEDLESHAIQRERLTRAERVIQLPTRVEADEAEASSEHGVVRIHLPKAEEEREKQIGVQ